MAFSNIYQFSSFKILSIYQNYSFISMPLSLNLYFFVSSIDFLAFFSISNITLLSLCHFQRCHYSTFYFYLPLIDFPATLESFTKVTYMPVQYLSIFHIQILSIFQYYSSFFSCCQSEIEYRSTVKYAHQIAFHYETEKIKLCSLGVDWVTCRSD